MPLDVAPEVVTVPLVTETIPAAPAKMPSLEFPVVSTDVLSTVTSLPCAKIPVEKTPEVLTEPLVTETIPEATAKMPGLFGPVVTTVPLSTVMSVPAPTWIPMPYAVVTDSLVTETLPLVEVA